MTPEPDIRSLLESQECPLHHAGLLAICPRCMDERIRETEARAREEERAEARLMIAQIRCCSCEEFIHNLDPNCDGCGMCRPVREWLRLRAKQGGR